MIKKLLIYIGVAVLLFFVAYYLHSYVISATDSVVPFSLNGIYIFHFTVSLLLVVMFELLASLTNQFKDQLGFLYLGSMALKIMLFCIVFRDVLFSDLVLSYSDSISLLIPIFIFIFFEVFFIAKILNRTT